MKTKDRILLSAFMLACLLAAGWALYLVGMHYDVVARLDTGACGPEGGCFEVLQSEDAEILGIPVSVPAVPMYLFLAVLAAMSLAGRLPTERISALAMFCGLSGLAFGGWLLFVMLFWIGSFCRFCALMDVANLVVMGLAVALHPGGARAAFAGIGGVLLRLRRPGAELALLPVVAIGTLLVHAATRPPSRPGGEQGAASTTATGNVPSLLPEPRTPLPVARAVPGAPAPGTRRLVLQAERADLPLDSSVPFRGREDAPVQVVVFGDFQCPYCKKAAGNVELLMEDPDVGDDVRVAFMHYPMHESCNASPISKSLHKYACGSSAAAICAGQQGRFWEMHDLLYRNNGRLRASNLDEYAEILGLDRQRFGACLTAPSTREKLLADSRIGSTAGVRGTPTLFVNGRMLVGAQPLESLRAAVGVELEGREGRVLLDVAMDGEVTGDLSGAATTVTLHGPAGPFTIDAFEASVAQGRAVSAAGVEPARSHTWHDAAAACEAAGKRLCTEEEWLVACAGALQVDEDSDGNFSRDLAQGRQHSYGEHFREGWCADSRAADDTRRLLTGNHPRCSTPEGVYDMEGVTKEWVGLTPDRAALKGGSYKSQESARCTYYKDDEAPDTRDDSIGFRCCSGGDPDKQAGAEEFPGGKVGDVVRDFAGPLASGGAQFGSRELRGSPFVLTFWATWCEPCKKELPALAEAWRQQHGAGLQVLGVNVDSEPDRARAWLAANPLPFPVILDTDKAIMDTFQSRGGGVPLTFWVRRDGTIRQRTTGYDEAAHADFTESVQAIMAR